MSSLRPLAAPVVGAALLALATAAPAAHAQAPSRVTKATTGAEPAAGTALEAVVAAERAFSRMSEERGMRDAFLAHFADDGVVFRERIARAKPYYAALPPSPGVLAWIPAWGGVSASEDLAFTTGPWTLRRSAADTAPASTGQFASVWARQADGQWKVLADIGATGPAMPAPTFTARALPGGTLPARGGASSAAVAEGQRAMLVIADRGLAASSRANGPAPAFGAVAAADVRGIWPAAAPVMGRDSAVAALAARAARHPGAAYEWQTSDARVSRAGDLGVTWGTYAVRAADGGSTLEQGSYLRVWGREQGGWRVLLDAVNPVPAR